MKIPMHISLLTLQLSISGPSYALQLWYSPDDVPDTFPQACRVALSQNITCSELVSGSKVAAQQLYSTSELNEYCTTSCAESLQQFQQGVHDGCGDQILSHGSISTTGAQLADPLVWAYNVTCLKDVNGYCNPLLFNGSSALTLCSDCVLSYMVRMLESEYGRSRFSDEGFARQLSSCGVPATSYPYTTPTSTGAATASTGSPSASPTSTGRACPGDSYTVAETDTCKSIAAENSIPLGTFLADNSIDQNCTTLRTGSEVCLSPPCSLYTVADGDTCKSIIAGKGYYMNQFLSWNPTIHQNCDNLHSMVGHEVCISPPGSTEWDVATTNRTSTMSFTMFPGEWETGPAPTPVTTEVSYPAIPTEFITITSTVTINQTEQSILNDYMKYCPINNIDYDNGFQWIDLSEDCQEILEPYCTPDIDAPSPSSTQFPDSCTPARVSATTTSGTPTPTSNVPSPTMPGTATSCNRFHLVIAGDGCSDLAAAYDISLDDFYTWNPGVGDGCSTLKTEYYVCVGVASSSSASTSTNPPTSTSSDSTPSPTMTGTASNCNKYHLVKEGDACYDLAAEYGISLDNFYTWNPGVGGDCSTLRTEYYVCVGVSTSSGPSSTPTSGSTPSPTLGGTAANCNNYHYVEEGDGCYDLAVEYDVSLDDFYTWNSGVGDDCSTLQLGYYVCVGISGSTGPSSTTNKPSSTTSTGGGGTAPTEVMPGTIASCKKYHKVISGDGCWDLASEYGISLDDFYAWNPAVGDDCNALQLDYYVCVGV
ncbi:hypothetical protein BDV18DRAFT_139700 [Aspergillus unguis]